MSAGLRRSGRLLQCLLSSRSGRHSPEAPVGPLCGAWTLSPFSIGAGSQESTRSFSGTCPTFASSHSERDLNDEQPGGFEVTPAGGGPAAESSAPGTDFVTAEAPDGRFGLEAILDAAGAGEAHALVDALADTWIFNRTFQRLLIFGHDTSELPWWGVIAGTTALCRILILPLSLMQVRNTYRLTQARPAMEQLKGWFEAEKARGNPHAARQYQLKLAEIWRQYNCNPGKSLVTMAVQVPLFVGFFSSLRSFAAAKVPSLTHGGMLWFSDLTVADPYYVLPVLTSAILWLSAEYGVADGMQGQPPETVARLKNGMRFVAVLLVPICVTMPTGVFMYWITNNTWSFLQALALKVPFVRKLANLPDLEATRPATPQGIPLPGRPLQTFGQPPAKRKVKAGK